LSFRSAVDAGRNGTAGIVYRDAPEIAQAEGKRPRGRGRCVVEVVTIFFEVFTKLVVVVPAKEFEEFGAGFGDIDAPLRLIVAQAFARRAEIRAKIRIGFHRGAVGVKRINVGGHSPGIFIARVALNTVQNRVEVVSAKQSMVFEKLVDGDSACGAHREGEQSCFVESGDLFGDGELGQDLAEIAAQRSLPAQGIDAVSERSGDQFQKTVHSLDARVVRRQAERSHISFNPEIASWHRRALIGLRRVELECGMAACAALWPPWR